MAEPETAASAAEKAKAMAFSRDGTKPTAIEAVRWLLMASQRRPTGPCRTKSIARNDNVVITSVKPAALASPSVPPVSSECTAGTAMPLSPPVNWSHWPITS